MGTSNNLNTMDNSLSFLAPLMELAKDEEVKEKVLEVVAKTFFSSNTVTVNVLPAIALAAVSVFLAVGILGLVAPDLLGLSGSSSNVAYGAPSSSSVAGSYGGGPPAGPPSEYAEQASAADPSPSYDSEYRSANGFNEFRSLSTNVLDGSLAPSGEELASKMEQMANNPLVTELGNSIAKMIQ